jgi:monoamine oxidase
MDGSDTNRIIVVGGGLAGLSSAWLAQSAGLEVAVLEAEPTCGGRIRSTPARHLPGWTVDLGGELIGEAHSVIRSLCRTAQIDLVGFDVGGGGILPARVRCQEQFLGSSELACLEGELSASLETICGLAEGVDPVRPWRTNSDRLQLASIAVEDWLSQQGFSERLVSLFCDHTPRGQSVLALLACVSAGGGVDFFLAGESKTIEGGARRVTQFLADSLSGRVFNGHTVTALRRRGSGVEVVGRGPHGPFIESGAAAIVAVPPPCWPHFEIEGLEAICLPAMTANRKVVIELDISNDDDVELAGLSDGPCRLVWPSPQAATRRRSTGAVVSMLALPTGMAPSMRTADLAEQAAQLIGIDSKSILAAHEVRWDLSPFARGTYPVYGPHILSENLEKLQDSSPPLFFCGDWILPGWSGYMEGAARSAHHCIDNVLQFIGGTRPTRRQRTSFSSNDTTIGGANEVHH